MSRPLRPAQLFFAVGACASILAGTLGAARAGDVAEITVSIKDHKFEPAQIKVAASKAIKLTVSKLDATPEEFESKALGIDKVVAGKRIGGHSDQGAYQRHP